jgi:hypothetical protein
MFDDAAGAAVESVFWIAPSGKESLLTTISRLTIFSPSFSAISQSDPWKPGAQAQEQAPAKKVPPFRQEELVSLQQVPLLQG